MKSGKTLEARSRENRRSQRNRHGAGRRRVAIALTLTTALALGALHESVAATEAKSGTMEMRLYQEGKERKDDSQTANLPTNQSPERQETKRQAISVYTDGLPYEGEVRVVNGHAYVSLREFSCLVDNAVVTWDQTSETATVKTDALTLTAWSGAQYLMANGRYLWCSEGVFTTDGVLYVPLQRAAQAFGFDNAWNFTESANYLTRKCAAIQPAEEFYTEEDVYWLSRIINAEAEGEPFEGKLAVGSVIMNRMREEAFPDGVYEVIFDNDCGVQFTPTVNGAIENEPTEESVIAAKLCLEGYRVSTEILYFLNPAEASNWWVPANCTFVMSIGGHDFYA